MRRWMLCLGLAAGLAGCDDDLTTEGGGEVSDLVVTTQEESGINRTVIQALDEEAWVPVSLGDGFAEAPADGWDLRFRRIEVEQAPGVEAQTIVGGIADFEAATGPDPDAEWVGQPADPEERPPLGNWWLYNPAQHTVSPDLKYFVVRTDGGACLKLKFTNYYDDAGTRGVVTLLWAPIDGCP